MQFALANTSAPKFVRIVQSSNPTDLQNRVAEALAELANTTVTIGADTFRPFVLSMDLAGGGDGHVFVVTIEASVGAFGGSPGPLDPAVTTVQFFMAGNAAALARKQLAAQASLPASTFFVGALKAGASGGSRFMGANIVLDDVAALNSALAAPATIFYAEDAVADAVAVPIAVATTPVVVPGTYTLTTAGGGGWTNPAPGVLQYDGAPAFTALVRTRLAVRAAAAGPFVVRVGALDPVGLVFAGTETFSRTVDNVLFHMLSAETIFTFNPDAGINQVAIGVANDTSTDDLEVLASELIVERAI